MDNKVNFLRGTSAEYATVTKDNDTFYYTTDNGKLYLGDKEITGGNITVDDALSDTSENPVQNKVINAALSSKAALSDIPTTLPANGGNADTVGNVSISSGDEVGLRKISAGTTDLTAGTSELETGAIYLVYE